MSISSIFNNASTSLAAQRVALDVTSENITNVNTDGYSRQRVIFESGPITTQNVFPLGNGVQVAAVQRIYDDVLNKQINDATNLQSNNESKSTILQQIEPFLNEIGGNSIGDAMQKLSDAWQALTLNPSGISERQTVIGRAQVLVDTFHQVSNGITNAQNFADKSLSADTTEISTKANEIAAINSQIKSYDMGSGNANELRDRRDLLLQDISKKVGITYSEQKDGTMEVKLLGGQTLVSGVKYATVYTGKGTGGVTTNTVWITQAGEPPLAPNTESDTNVTNTIGGINRTGGDIGALLYMRDTSTTGYLQKLDELAYNYSYQVNSQHAAGYNLNGATNVNFFTTPAGLPPSGPPVPPALPSVYSGFSTAIDLAITTTNQIAAADTNPLGDGGGVGNNKNALKLAALANKTMTFSGGAETTAADYYSSMVAGIGVDVQIAKNMSTQNEAFVNQLNNLRDSNSGVSLDEEMTNMLKYQKAFEGASKVISVANQMLDTVMSLIS